MEKVIKVGKRNAIYLPNEVVESLGIGEGSSLLLTVKDGKIEILPLRRANKYWAEISSREVEEVGEEISRDLGVTG
ncbi:hypothetical protein L3N51_01439 [Metallosphaera sp. J1]|uniref:AbrB/MazE/SpoVT family DNA-binding domain-containing protein n=1 Tax=Metallosphaera TaxID=41980 RepID=UPI001EE03939|nr:AbrB/MazE/SpoVT family DNA-binding domain-containing protein [Metallosphaera javensis (ex Hofmann et al. 2022)]MCG3109149.1 hypothetical protein [Metallosphaera javensis (ex Hofmann et al. 2022)]BCS93704.1 MAG: AbrB family transcriptional regulator [Metallosphaera javensis (ex Sakai et al. 2022)]